MVWRLIGIFFCNFFVNSRKKIIYRNLFLVFASYFHFSPNFFPFLFPHPLIRTLIFLPLFSFLKGLGLFLVFASHFHFFPQYLSFPSLFSIFLPFEDVSPPPETPPNPISRITGVYIIPWCWVFFLTHKLEHWFFFPFFFFFEGSATTRQRWGFC